jgi:hypothetical protein
MKKFIATYNNPNAERINFGIMNKSYDESLVTYIVDTCKSLEVLKYIKFSRYEYISDEHLIDFNNYIKSRRTKNKKDLTKYMLMKDSRYGELILEFDINCKGESKKISKRILVPKADDNGYYLIKGKKYFLLYQLVDNSTYTTKKNLTLKSLMPVSIKRDIKTFSDIEGKEYTAPTYVIYVFRKEVDILLFYFVKYGMEKTLKFFSVDKLIKFVEKPDKNSTEIYFQINSKIFLEVNRNFFLEHQYVQSIVFMLLSTMNNRVGFGSLEDKIFWIEKIGSLFSTNQYNYHEKGTNTMTFFDRMLDETTRRILKIDNEHKRNIYTIVRWLIQNFNELKNKDNLDLDNKRLRCNEFVASLLTKEFSAKLNRIISLGSKVTIDRIEEIFKFSGDILLTQLFRSNLLRYDDIVNDMNFWNWFRFTLRGPNSVGNRNQNNISVKMRGMHPSYLGRVDIAVIGNSEPGLSSIVTPFCETTGLFFSDKEEPQAFKEWFDYNILKYREQIENKTFIIIPPEEKENLERFASEIKEKFIVEYKDKPSKKYTYVKFIHNPDNEEN